MTISASKRDPRICQAGFSLLELAVVTVIVSVVAASGLVVGQATIKSTQNAVTNRRMDVIETALLAYRRANDRLPCPSNLTLDFTSANYGMEAANAGSCTGGSPAANFSYTSGGNTVVEGGVPVRVLNLPDEFMYDGNGHRIRYAVWSLITGSKGFINYGIEPNCGSMSIMNAAGAARSNRALYALLSHGNNGHGAYNVAGDLVVTASVNADELTNCHCTTTGADTGFIGDYVQKDYTEDPANPLNNYDDVVRFKERWQMQHFYDEYNPGGYLTCPSVGPGSRAYGTSAEDNAGSAIALGDINADGNDDLAIGLPRGTGAGLSGSVAVVFGTPQGLPNPLMLSALDGTNGFWINSSEVDDLAGSALEMGDLNRDGIVDLVIGAPGANAGNGAAYIVYGHSNPWATSTSLAAIGAGGVKVNNDMSSGTVESFGAAIGVGDIDIDGRNDLVIGAPTASSSAGGVYMFMGYDKNWSSGTMQVSTNYTNVSGGDANDRAGFAIEIADYNADLAPDVLVGMPGDGVTMPGRVSVLIGRRWGWYHFKFYRLYGRYGFYINGESAGSEFGSSIARGDIDGDYIQDLLIGAPGYNSDVGATYAFFGKTRRRLLWWWADTLLNGKLGTRINGVTTGDRAGAAVSSADINGDGISDAIIAAPDASPGALAGAGTVYIYFGKRSWSATENLSTIDGTVGFMLNGSTAGDAAGSVLAVGDANRDYIGDVFIGAPLADYSATNAGAVYSFYGQRQQPPWTLNIDLNSL